MADVFVRHRRSQTRSRERRFGEIPLSAGEIEYLTRQDEAARRRQRLLHVREQEKRAAQLVTQRYRENLRRLQSHKLQLAQRDHRQAQDTVLSTLHEKYQYSLQGMGTAQRNAREKMVELMELAQLEQDKWSVNRRGEKLRFQDAVEVELEDASVRLARRREIERNLRRLKEMSLKHRGEASARARRELEQELKLQKAQEDAQRFREQHLETEEFSFPRKTPRDVTAYQFTRTHCVAVPGAGTRSGSGSKSTEPSTRQSTFREVKVIRHNRTTQQTTTSAIDQAEVYRKEMELKQENDWRMREQQAKMAGSRGQDALQTVESIHEGTRALEWLIELERQARVEKTAQLEAEVVKNEPHRDERQRVDDSGSEEFARMFGIEEGSEGMLDGSFDGRDVRLDGHPERIAARRAGSVSESDESWLLDDEWRTPSERFDTEEQDIPPVQRTPAERMVDQKIESMNDLLKKVASYGGPKPADRDEEVAERDVETDSLSGEGVSHQRGSRERYEEWRRGRGPVSRPTSDGDEDRGLDARDKDQSVSRQMNDNVTNRPAGSPEFDGREVPNGSLQGRIDSSGHQTLRPRNFANQGIIASANSGSAHGHSKGEEFQSESAETRARRTDLSVDAARELPRREGRESVAARHRTGEIGAGEDWAAQEVGQSRQLAHSFGRDQRQGASRHRSEDLSWLDDHSNAGIEYLADLNDRAAAHDEEWDRASHDSEVEARQESIDGLEERLQQALEERNFSDVGGPQHSSSGEYHASLGNGRNVPAATDSSREQPFPGLPDAEGRRATSHGPSNPSRRAVGSRSSTAGEPWQQVNEPRGSRSVGDEDRDGDVSNDDINAYHRLPANSDRVWHTRSPPNYSTNDGDNEHDERDYRAYGAANNSNRRIVNFDRARSIDASTFPNATDAPASQPSQWRRRGGQRGGQREDESVSALQREERGNVAFEPQGSSISISSSVEERSLPNRGAELFESGVQPAYSSRDERPKHGDLVAEAAGAPTSRQVDAESSWVSNGEMPAQGRDQGGDRADDRDIQVDQVAYPSAVGVLDESADDSDLDSSMLFTEGMVQPGGRASYLRQMQQEGIAMQSSSSSFPQYSLPLSDSFSSMNESVIEADAGVATLTNQLLPMFPRQARRVSGVSATADELIAHRQQAARRGSTHGEAAILVKGLAQQDSEETEAVSGDIKDAASDATRVATQAENRREERVQQDISLLPRRQGPANDGQPRGPLHDLSFSSDSSSDMSALMYLTRMRKVASSGTAESHNGEDKNGQGYPLVSSSSESLSGLSSVSSTPVHPSSRHDSHIQTQQTQSARDNHRDSVGSASSSTPSIDARFQYLVNMTAVAGKALPLHMNLPPNDLSGGDMRFPPPQVKLNVYSSDSEVDDGASQTGYQDSGRVPDQVSKSEIEQAERRDSLQDGRIAAGRTQFPLPAAPFGQLDLSNPPAPVFGSSSSSSLGSEWSGRSDNSKNERGSRRSDRSLRSDGPMQQFGLEELSQRLAGLPPPPFGSFDMSQPPDPLGWGHGSDNDASSAFGSEANESRVVDAHDDNAIKQKPQAQPLESTSTSPRKKGEALFVPLETSQADASATAGSLADAFRQRHPNFHRRAQEANTSLLEQRREQLAARRAESVASAPASQLQQTSARAKPKAPPSPARSRTPSTMSMPPPALLDRLATGERTKISAQEMKDRTRRLYSQLPEVAERKRQEDVLERRRQRLTEMREREKLRRQQQRQR